MEAASPNGLSSNPEGHNSPDPSALQGRGAPTDGSGTPDTVARQLSRLEVSAAAAPGDGVRFAIPSAAEVEQHRRAMHAAPHNVQTRLSVAADPPPPPLDEIGESLTIWIRQHGFAHVVRELFRAVPLHELMDLSRLLSDHLCGQDCVHSIQFGGEYDPGPLVRPPGNACLPRRFMSVSILSASQVPSMLLDGERPLSADVQAAGYVYDFRTCHACEPSEFGTVPGAQCTALALLESLKGDLENHQNLIEREEAEGGELSELRRAARYIMYRKFVAAGHGRLGQHIRVRIPLCVIREM